MVLEQAVKIIPKVAPEIEEAAAGFVAETLPSVERAFADSGIKTYIFGGKAAVGNGEKIVNLHFPTKGPVWTEEVLYRRSAQLEHGEDAMFGNLTEAELRGAEANNKWLDNAGFQFNSFYKPHFSSKRLPTGEGTMSPNVVRRLTEASQNSMASDRLALSSHYFRDNNGQEHLMEIFDTKGAAARLNYSRRTVRELAYTDKLPAHMVQGAHGLEWRIVLPAAKTTAQTTGKDVAQTTEEALFRKAAKGEPWHDFFRWGFRR